jgi:crotonobetainyl-CoA:carnitine CoA-transferase CaiB-like acyl-CoA transferase
MWTLAPDIVGAPYGSAIPNPVRTAPGNPIVNAYPTKDGRWLYLVCLQADRFWAEVCTVIGRPELVEDERFADAAARFENRKACVAELDKAFSSRTLEEWRAAFDGFGGVWAPTISFTELHDHAQIEPNGYLPTVTGHNGKDFRLVGVPVQFDEQPCSPQGPAPETGQDTELVLVEMGIDWDEISAYRERGAMGA